MFPERCCKRSLTLAFHQAVGLLPLDWNLSVVGPGLRRLSRQVVHTRRMEGIRSHLAR